MEELLLPDGTRLGVRALEPEDKDELAEGIEHLSASSRYLRFFSPVRKLSSGQLTYLTTIDHDRHEALVVIEPASGEGVAVARYIVTDDQPRSAEIAVTVDDAWQGRGVGTVLLQRLASHARMRGVARFNALILAENKPMLRLIESVGPVRSRELDGDTVSVMIDLESAP